MHQLLGRRVRSGSGGEERRRLLVPGSEQFSHCFMMASQDSLGTRHLSALSCIHFCGTAGPKCLALWGSPILVGRLGRGQAFAWNRGIEDEHSREQKERHLSGPQPQMRWLGEWPGDQHASLPRFTSPEHVSNLTTIRGLGGRTRREICSDLCLMFCTVGLIYRASSSIIGIIEHRDGNLDKANPLSG